MPEESRETSVKAVIDILEQHNVEYMLIGGQAEVLLGSPRITYDTDIAYPRDPENLKNLAKALRELNAKLRVNNEPLELPFPIDAKALALGNNFTFVTDVETLDILAIVEPIGKYENLLMHHEIHEAYGYKLKTIGLEDLIRVKEHICRQKDSESLYQLKAIRKVREEAK